MQRRRFVGTALTTLSVALAGCTDTLGSGGDSTDSAATSSPSPPPTETGTPIETPTPDPWVTSTATASPTVSSPGTDCAPYLFVRIATAEQRTEANDVVDYADLHPLRQEEFLEALENNGSTQIWRNIPPTWRDPPFVNYEDDVYLTEVAVC